MEGLFTDSWESFTSIKDSDLLKSNNPPSASEQLSLKATRDNIVASLERVNASIAATKRQLESLEMNRARLQELAEEYSIPLSPIRRVPADITLCIFKRLEETWPKDSFSLKKGKWQLAQVCSSWRSILYDTPSFWNKITIDIAHFPLPFYAVTILSTIIGRTKSIDLDVMFKTSCTESMSTSLSTQYDYASVHLLELLCSYSHRWRSFYVTIPMSHWVYLRQIENTLLRLEDLSIDVFNRTRRTLRGKCMLFATAPKLKRVSLGSNNFPPPMILSIAPAELSIGLYPAFQDRLSEVISSTVKKLRLLCIPQDEATDSVVASFPNVTSLEVEDLEDSTIRYLSLPGLRRLRILQWSPSQLVNRELESFITRSLPNESRSRRLFELHVSPIDSPSALDAKLFLAPFSFLQHLVLTAALGYFQNDKVLMRTMGGLLMELILPFSGESVASLPQLITLEIDFSSYSSPDVRNLVYKVVLSRTQLPDWFESSGSGCNLQKFSYTDDKHRLLTLLTYDRLRSQQEDEDAISSG